MRSSEGINLISAVGDAFGKPLLRPLTQIREMEPVKSSWNYIFRVMWSEEVKQQLLEYQPNMVLIDAFSSSALGMGCPRVVAQLPNRTFPAWRALW